MTQQEYNKWLSDYNAGLRSDKPPQNWKSVAYKNSDGSVTEEYYGKNVVEGSGDGDVVVPNDYNYKEVIPNSFIAFSAARAAHPDATTEEMLDMLAEWRYHNFQEGRYGTNDLGLTSSNSNLLTYVDASIDNPYWNSLSDLEKTAIIRDYSNGEVKDWTTLWGLLPGTSEEIDINSLIRDFNQLSNIEAFNLEIYP